ncbi:MAG: tRNA uridine-5-carboxymethylaminomethyl(34) synthesis GTPase MnmE, partial [bacterium]
MQSDSDTICAVSTPRGQGGIALIRLSGSDSHRIALSVFRKKSGGKLERFDSHKLYYGCVVDPHSGLHLEEVLLSLMRSPRTYTTEDMAEINAHGGAASVNEILGLCLQAGARLSEPGEFTRRAFLKGRIDLTQAEAVIDLIRARSEQALKLAVKQLDGSIGQAVRTIKEDIVKLLALVELSLDFVEEDLEVASAAQVEKSLLEIKNALAGLIRGFDQGRLVREGISVVLTGLPNAGKSSLLNALLRQDRAIVTHIPGTTTDVIHEFINLEGFPVRLSDTAGITGTSGLIEREGVKRSRAASAEADLILLLIDANAGITSEDLRLLEGNSGKPVLVLLNKSDLSPRITSREKEKLHQAGAVKKILSISTTN